MTRTPYPSAFTNEELLNSYKEVQRLREAEDIPDFTNLNQVFVSGRSTTRIPSSPTDVLSGDNVGDVANDGSFVYTLLDIGGGTLRWDRRAIDVGW